MTESSIYVCFAFFLECQFESQCESCDVSVGTVNNFCNGSNEHDLALTECSLTLPMGSHECMTVECNIYADVQERLSEG